MYCQRNTQVELIRMATLYYSYSTVLKLYYQSVNNIISFRIFTRQSHKLPDSRFYCHKCYDISKKRHKQAFSRQYTFPYCRLSTNCGSGSQLLSPATEDRQRKFASLQQKTMTPGTKPCLSTFIQLSGPNQLFPFHSFK